MPSFSMVNIRALSLYLMDNESLFITKRIWHFLTVNFFFRRVHRSACVQHADLIAHAQISLQIMAFCGKKELPMCRCCIVCTELEKK
jgi:hypothetical protein